MKMALLKSNLFLQQSRTIFSQTVLSKYNRALKKKRKQAHLDEYIRFGKNENDLYEKSTNLWDRFVDPLITKAEKPHPETPKTGHYESERPYGVIYSKQPFPLVLEAGKRYMWCSCGRSNRQPICDGTHKLFNRLTAERSVRFNHFAPIVFEVEEDGEYWMCNCKQSKNRPFCDGTHSKLDLGGKDQKKKSS